MSANAASAPGKVLLAGGYLILDRAHTGLVFGLNARIHVHVQADDTLEGIFVHSPQFKQAEWRYTYHVTSATDGVAITPAQGASVQANPFVETSLSYALSYIIAASPSIQLNSSRITILADDDYYSQNNPKEKTDGFTNFNIPLFDAHKTGLGSSAALVTAFTAAVLQHYLPTDIFSLDSDVGQDRLHNLAQAAHSAAQGKIGSGFDVASAVYGSSVYRRFSPSILSSIGESSQQGFAQKLRAVVEDQSRWDTEVTKSAVAIPKGVRLVMCDLDCGSKTPGMVKQVLAWRKDNPEVASALWGELQSKNEALARALVAADSRSESNGYTQLSAHILDVRRLVQDMSQKSAVAIEPAVISKLLDAASAVEGVIGGVTPGAGGYDAVALLIEDKPEVIERLESFLKTWQDAQSQQSNEIGKVQLLSVSGEMEGARVEPTERYKAWTI